MSCSERHSVRILKKKAPRHRYSDDSYPKYPLLVDADEHPDAFTDMIMDEGIILTLRLKLNLNLNLSNAQKCDFDIVTERL